MSKEVSYLFLQVIIVYYTLPDPGLLGSQLILTDIILQYFSGLHRGPEILLNLLFLFKNNNKMNRSRSFYLVHDLADPKQISNSLLQLFASTIILLIFQDHVKIKCTPINRDQRSKATLTKLFKQRGLKQIKCSHQKWCQYQLLAQKKIQTKSVDNYMIKYIDNRITLRQIIQQKPFLLAKASQIAANKQFINSLDYVTPPIQKRGIWIYGASGIGKSYYVRHNFRPLYLKDSTKWWNNYLGQRFVLFQDWGRSHLGLVDYFKIWADIYQFIAQIKFSSVKTCHEKFIVTSQHHPQELIKFPQQLQAIIRRFDFYTIIDHKLVNI